MAAASNVLNTKTSRFLSTIARLSPHKMVDTVTVNNIRSVIIALGRPLAEIVRNQILNTKIMEEKQKEVKHLLWIK